MEYPKSDNKTILECYCNVEHASYEETGHSTTEILSIVYRKEATWLSPRQMYAWLLYF